MDCLQRMALAGCVALVPWSGMAVATESLSLVTLYKKLHQHPELSYQEKSTSALMAMELQQAGFVVTPNVGGYGVVGVLKSGEGPVVMIRTDMDALPVPEQTGLPYASKVSVTGKDGVTVPVMHACGHDIHMATWVGVARRLAAAKDQWQGTVLMVAQPAEERGGGAKAMLADGLFTRFPRPDHVLALHVSGDMPAGFVGLAVGPVMANVDSVEILVRGVGGHGAAPHTTKDPVVLASQIVLALQTLVSREVDPLDPSVVTVGSIHGGTKHNIIPGEVKLQLTVRSYTDNVRQTLLDGIKRIAEGQARSAGVPEALLPVVKLGNEYTPATVNTPNQTLKLLTLFDNLYGAERVVRVRPVMGGEDFGRYSREAGAPIESTMFQLGSVKRDTFYAARTANQQLPSLHSPFYAPDPEPTLTTGVDAMTAAARALLGQSR